MFEGEHPVIMNSTLRITSLAWPILLATKSTVNRLQEKKSYICMSQTIAGPPFWGEKYLSDSTLFKSYQILMTGWCWKVWARFQRR